jgi:hypothetical protein
VEENFQRRFSVNLWCGIFGDLNWISLYEGSFLYSRTRHERKRLEQQEKCIFEYRLFAFEYKYHIVSITFLIHYKNDPSYSFETFETMFI